jgi:serine protease Do
VIDGAERITEKLSDGRSLRGSVVGSDPDTDIALIKVEAPSPLRHGVLGNSDTLRVGEWVLAIGNPLAYEHTVTVGIVSFIGRKLFDSSLDNYIQTDAAISFGNSGGPLINTRGEIVGINSAVSRQASNIGFAVPINQARAILPQLQTLGRVSRGYIGVALRGVDPDVQASLGLTRSDGALVQDVTTGSPGARAGIKPYDLIVAVDRTEVRTNDALIREIAERQPGSTARLELVRDGRPMDVQVKLAERPGRVATAAAPTVPAGRGLIPNEPTELGLTLIEIDEGNAHRFDVPAGMTGLLVQRVEPLSAAFEAGITRGQILLEINRRAVDSVAGYRRVVQASRPGAVLAVFLYDPDLDQRAIYTVRTEPR